MIFKVNFQSTNSVLIDVKIIIFLTLKYKIFNSRALNCHTITESIKKYLEKGKLCLNTINLEKNIFEEKGIQIIKEITELQSLQLKKKPFISFSYITHLNISKAH